MIKQLTEKIKRTKGELITYDFEEKCTGVAGFCPDCKSVVSFVPAMESYLCLNPECTFEANKDRERVWVSNNTNESEKQKNPEKTA